MDREKKKENICSLTETIMELASKSVVDDFNNFKDIIGRSSPQILDELLLLNARKGITRNVEYIVNYCYLHEINIDDAINDCICITSMYHHNGILSYLLENTQNCNAGCYENRALKNAITSKNLSGINILLNKGVTINDPDIIILYCSLIDNVNTLEKILEHCVTTDLIDRNIDDMFLSASSECNIYLMKFLINMGANIDYANGIALKMAIKKGNLEVLNLLINKGADINIGGGILGYMTCYESDNDHILKLLMDNKIILFDYHNMIYDHCIKNNFMNCASLLIKYSYNNIQDEKKDDFECSSYESENSGSSE